MESSDRDPLTEKIIGIAIQLHRVLGPGLLESTYEECLCHDLREAGFNVQRHVRLPIIYKSLRLEEAYRIDLIVDDKVILELKTVDKVMPIHHAQLLTYLKLSGIQLGLILNFQTTVLKDGLKRMKL